MPAKGSSTRISYTCSCGKNQDQVRRLVAGPNNLYICGECVDLAYDLMHDESQPSLEVKGGSA